MRARACRLRLTSVLCYVRKKTPPYAFISACFLTTNNPSERNFTRHFHKPKKNMSYPHVYAAGTNRAHRYFRLSNLKVINFYDLHA